MELRFSPLFSGSSGNAIYVGCGNTHLLVDAGLSGVRIQNELEKIGLHPSQLAAILATHEHIDHIRGIGVLSRKFHLPVYATEGTWRGMMDKVGHVDDENICHIVPEQNFYLGDMEITPFATPHDAAEPTGFTFEAGGSKFSIATDVGCIKKGWMNHVRGSDAVLLESNYDPDMLKAGSYPYELKRRILSTHGHLSNDDAGACAVELVKSGVSQIILGHLSKENNFPELALKCCESALQNAGILPQEDVRVRVAKRDCITGIFGISGGFE